jgi:beta-glucosidase
VQVYVAYEGSRVPRPVRELKAFAKVALEPGESRVVSLAIPARQLAYYDEQSASWQVEAIGYRVFAGPNSRALPLEGRFRVAAPLSYR